MGGAEREDFLRRQIKGFAAMLARIVGLRQGGQNEEARAELEKAYGELLESQGELIRRVDSATAARLLGSKARILAYAELLEEEALQEEAPRAAAELKAIAAEIRAQAAHGRSSS